MDPLSPTGRRHIAARIAPLMFALSLLFLACLATLVVLWSEIPDLSGQSTAAATAEFGASENVQRAVVVLLLGIWPLFWIEFLAACAIRPWDRNHRSFYLFGLVCCLFPPLRMGARSPDVGGCIWLPGLGWRQADDALRSELLRHLSVPMIAIALLILPVLAAEYFLKEQITAWPALRLGLQISTGIIWLAFAAEFIVMISLAERKLAYCKEHWIDLAIILLPLVSFLRSLRVLRASRLSQVTRVQQLSKMARVYRLRGVSTKALRALMLLELAHRLVGNSPEKRLARLRRQHSRMKLEMRALEKEIAHLEREQARQRSVPQTNAAKNRPRAEQAGVQ